MVSEYRTLYIVVVTQPHNFVDVVDNLRWAVLHTPSNHLRVVASNVPRDACSFVDTTYIERTVYETSPLWAAYCDGFLSQPEVAYDQIVFLTDRCLVTAADFGEFFRQHLVGRDTLGLLGVGCHAGYANPAVLTSALFKQGLPVTETDALPDRLVDDCLIVTKRFGDELFRRQDDSVAGEWLGTFADYLSLMCYWLGYDQCAWGRETKPLPPLYVNFMNNTQTVSPQLLVPQIKLYGELLGVMEYPETVIRQIFRYARDGRPVPVGLQHRPQTFAGHGR